VLGDDTLKTIARELVQAVRRNVTIDWTVRESVRAKPDCATLETAQQPPARKITDSVARFQVQVDGLGAIATGETHDRRHCRFAQETQDQTVTARQLPRIHARDGAHIVMLKAVHASQQLHEARAALLEQRWQFGGQHAVIGLR